jgi:DNA-binding beta-propeller fold protein YncE
VAVDVSGKFAYVANFNSGDVSVFTIDPHTGALTPVGLPLPAELAPFSVITTAKIQ